MAWIELLAIVAAALLGWCWGRRLGRREGRAWMAWAGICGMMLVGIFVGHRWVWLSFVRPVSWLVDAWGSPVILAVSLTMLMTLVVGRLPARRTRRLGGAMAGALLLYAAVWPQVLVLAARNSLARIQTHLDFHGVCLQSRNYTCGPAAAVTCLRRMQVAGDEGRLALEAACRPPAGIEGQQLAAAITRLHGSAGISAEYMWVSTPEDLPLPAVACLKTAGGHDVAVLYVTPEVVLVGNPSRGLQVWTRADFAKAWTGAAVVMRRAGG